MVSELRLNDVVTVFLVHDVLAVISYINSIIALRQAKRKHVSHENKERPKTNALLANKIVLNDGEPRHDIAPKEIASYLKNSMNVLRGAFFDTHKGRVAYERMKKSQAYAEYLALSYTLKNMNLHELKTTAEKKAFWVNMYNVIVIHGVIELGIMDSVKEVRSFFRRIRYQIGNMFFSPEDIEHGILRGNRRPPRSLFKIFGSNDRRLVHSVQELDPRIHFALVCASSSCPPISFYTAEKLDEELTIAGKSFINGGGVKPDRHDNHLSLSRVFKWYGSDFGNTIGERLRFIAQYLYDKNDRQYILDNAESIKIDYQDYDWRLNRY